MTADFKCCPSLKQHTGVFILNGDMSPVIVSQVFLLFFTLWFSCCSFHVHDQRISIHSLSSLPFHSSHFFTLISTSMHSCIITNKHGALLLCWSHFSASTASILTFNFLESCSPCFSLFRVFPSSCFSPGLC